MCHAQWLTHVNRILRLYVSMESSSENLVILVTYIVKIFAKIDLVIQRNSYIARPENVLIALLTDLEPHIREPAVSPSDFETRIIQENGLRLPTVKFDALSYTNLIDWQENITDPSILKSIPDEDIRLFAVQKADGELSLLHLLCHKQAVEMADKTVTEASASLCKKSEIEGFIRNQIESRKVMPKFDSKKDFHAI
ncbi:hypothetical protein AVEN_18822-1 [Araneus ventricosus]|uniref:Uncharacterized protein n=1 Tax=Araneus ventricosus TaxID=182803 RepID=A0A4Y2RF72_ARAVE|nr:hypothetical protein AVEN_18822-1 [Araneus ventricosus]